MQKICTKSMKIQLKIAVVAGLMALLITSCQKEDLPMPGVTPMEENGGSNMRVGGPENDGGALGGGNDITADSTGIVSGGDDDRDGGIVGGGDDDKDGGSKKAEPKKN